MDVVIYGAGGMGREIYDTLLSLNLRAPTFDLIGYADDNAVKGAVVNGVPVLGGPEILNGMSGKVGLILGMSNPAVRKMLHQRYRESFALPSIIHPTAIISSFATLGEGVLIQSNCVVAANAKVGNCVMMNAHSGVGHDAQISDYCSIMSYCDIAGASVLGELSFVGTGAKIIPSISIAAGSYICAGSIVFKEVLTQSKLMGNPAKIIG